MAHCALDLDDLIACAWLTIDRLGAAAFMLHLVAKIGELFGRVLGLRKVLAAAAACDLGRDGNALQTTRALLSARSLWKLWLESGVGGLQFLTSRSRTDRTREPVGGMAYWRQCLWAIIGKSIVFERQRSGSDECLYGIEKLGPVAMR